MEMDLIFVKVIGIENFRILKNKFKTEPKVQSKKIKLTTKTKDSFQNHKQDNTKILKTLSTKHFSNGKWYKPTIVLKACKLTRNEIFFKKINNYSS